MVALKSTSVAVTSRPLGPRWMTLMLVSVRIRWPLANSQRSVHRLIVVLPVLVMRRAVRKVPRSAGLTV
jgi:hypothetical protein